MRYPLFFTFLLIPFLLSAQKVDKAFNGWIGDFRTLSVNVSDSTLIIQGNYQQFDVDSQFDGEDVDTTCIILFKELGTEDYYQMDVDSVLFKTTTLIKLRIKDGTGTFIRTRPSNVYIGKPNSKGILPVPDVRDHLLTYIVNQYNNDQLETAITDALGVTQSILDDSTAVLRALVKIDSIDLIQDSIIVSFLNGVEVSRDTIANTGGGGAFSTAYVDDYGAVGDGVTDDYSAFASAIAAAGENGVIELTAGKTYLVCHSIVLEDGQTIEGNGATVKRCDQSNTAIAANYTAGDSIIILTEIPADWIVGDDVRIYTDNTDSGGSYPRRITAISGDTITIDTVLATSHTSGDSIMRAYIQIRSGDNWRLKRINVQSLQLNGNKGNNTANQGWRVNGGIKVFGEGSIIENCRFYDHPGECITGHGLKITNSNFNRIWGSAFHLSAQANYVDAAGWSIFSGNTVDSVGLSSYAVNEHNEGAVTVSFNGGKVIISNNHFRNGEQSIYGPITSAATTGTDNVVIEGNICENFSNILYDIGGPSGGDSVRNVLIIDNIFNNCGTNDYSDTQYGTLKWGDNILSGGTTLTISRVNSLIETEGRAITSDGTDNIDWALKRQKLVQIDLSGVSTDTLTFSNPKDWGEYIIHFTGVATDTITFPANLKNLAGSSVGSREITAEAMMEIYYYNNIYYTRDTIGTNPNATPVPQTVTGLTLWLDANEGITEGGGTVTNWSDQSGNGNDVTASSGQGPTQVLSIINSLPVVRFDGDSTGYMTLTGGINLDSLTWFMVAEMKDVLDANYRGFFGEWNGDGSQKAFVVTAHSTDSLSFLVSDDGSTNTLLSKTTPYSGFFYASGGVSSVGTELYFEAATEDSTTGKTLFGSTEDFYIGNYANRYEGSSLEFDLAELLIYNRRLSSAELTTIRSYLTGKYGL